MKRLVSMLLLCSILLSMHPALAESVVLPDPVVFSDGAVTFCENRDNEYALYRAYSVTGDTAAQYAVSYLTALLQIPQIKLTQSFAENYGDYSGMYYVFQPTGTCRTFSIGDQINGAAVVLYYDYDGTYAGHNILLYCSPDFTIGEKSAPQAPASTPTPAPAANPKAINKVNRLTKTTVTPAPVAACTDNGLTLINPITFFGSGYTYNNKAVFTAQDMEIILATNLNTGYANTAIFKFDDTRNAAADAQSYAQALTSSGYYTLEVPGEEMWNLYYVGPESPETASSKVTFHLQILLSANRMLFLFSQDIVLSTTDGSTVTRPTATPAPAAVCLNNGLMLINPITYFDGKYTYNGQASYTSSELVASLNGSVADGFINYTEHFQRADGQSAKSDAQTYAEALIASGYYELYKQSDTLPSWYLRYNGPETAYSASPVADFHVNVDALGSQLTLTLSTSIYLSATDGQHLSIAPSVTSKLAPSPTPMPLAILSDDGTLTIQHPFSFIGSELCRFTNVPSYSWAPDIDYTSYNYHTYGSTAGEAIFNAYKAYLDQLDMINLTQTLIPGFAMMDDYFYTPAEGYSFDTCEVQLSYNEDDPAQIFSIMLAAPHENPTFISLDLSSSIKVADLGIRMDHSLIESLLPVFERDRAIFLAKEKEEAEKESSTSSSDSSSSSSSSSDTSYTTQHKRYKNCSKPGCTNGKIDCSNCDGRGYKEKTVSVPNYSGKGVKYETQKEDCYRCSNGKVDCPACDNGKVEY